VIILCPYCKKEIRKEDNYCDGCETQYFISQTKSGKIIYLQELDGNLIIPIARMG
jgi:predicted amidophosphoribosyltransferase